MKCVEAGTWPGEIERKVFQKHICGA